MLNPKKSTWSFESFSADEENKDLLISLINSVIEPTPPIVELVIKNPYNLATYIQGARIYPRHQGAGSSRDVV